MENYEVFKVEDELGREYRLTGKTWSGGQGKVCVDESGHFIIKLTNHVDAVSRERIRKQIRLIRQLPLAGLPITQPLALLRPPYVGYVMEYLTEMEPIASLIYPPKGCIDVVAWYNETGGLRRRLEILMKLANILRKIHGKALVYGDISPSNVFLSSSSKHSEVYLIDVDNISYQTNTPNSYIHTPLFGAPEVVLHQFGVDTISDAYSFAVVAFLTLSLGHPLLGDTVIDNGPELEHQALIGKLPWIYHPSDDSNRSTYVLPKEYVMSKKLFDLFQATFGAGLLDRKRRPGMSAWEETLSKALQFVLTCPKCKGSFFKDWATCPWCGLERPAYLSATVDIYAVDEDGSLREVKTAVSGICLQYPGKFTILRRHLGYCDEDSENAILELDIDKQQIIARNVSGKDCFATHNEWKFENGKENGGRKEKIDRQKKSLRDTWSVHIGSLHITHPVIRFRYIG
jgi:eukaryotic-like serine/threonine-protein kinase